jgi:glycosyltransferase involved in cell wall biosynthesis
MRVLMLNYEFPPLGGGAANATKYLLDEFADRTNLVVDLVTSSPDGYREESLGDGIRAFRVDVAKDAIHYWTQREILRYSRKANRKSRALFEEFEYDHVHAWFGVPSGVLAWWLGRPFTVSLRGSDVPGYNERFTLQYIALKPLLRRVWEAADTVVANSRGLRDLALETKRMDIDVIPNGVAIDEFEPIYHDHERLQVCCVSRLVARKGVRYLVEAVARLPVELTIVGAGEREQMLKKRVRTLGIEDRVTFTGYVPHEEISGYYEAADVFVLPSFNEGMSNTILEAMAAGLPIVTTDTGGTAELIDDNGYVVPAGDSAAIVEALSAYVDDIGRRREHGRQSRATAEEMSWTTVADQYHDVYRRT